MTNPEWDAYKRHIKKAHLDRRKYIIEVTTGLNCHIL